MEKLKNRSLATLITIVVIVAATLFGVHRSVSGQVEKIERQFYDGVYLVKEGYTQKSISSQLSQRINASNGLLSIAGDFPALSSETSDLRSARYELVDARSLPDMFDANADMQSAYQKLTPLLLGQELSDSQKAAVSSYMETMDGAQTVIGESGYNSLVDEFEREVLGAFPISTLKYPALVSSPERFE